METLPEYEELEIKKTVMETLPLSGEVPIKKWKIVVLETLPEYEDLAGCPTIGHGWKKWHSCKNSLQIDIDKP